VAEYKEGNNNMWPQIRNMITYMRIGIIIIIPIL